MVLANGQILPPKPALYETPQQNIEGSALQAAAKHTIQEHNEQVETLNAMGAGQKGGRRKRRGGGNVVMHDLPEAHTIKGVSHEGVHIEAVNNLNKLLADSAGDKLGKAQPYDVKGGKRTRRKLNGRRNNRSHRRRNNKSSTRRRRSRRSMV